MMSQLFLAVSDDVHIKSQVVTLEWWKYIKYDQLRKNTHEKAVCIQNVCEL